ncbi:site-specific integrase [Lysobacter hankyongensis]|uniref:Site-specific integrase n=2 Tax=Lysobacter hankyongensis TaxID=1176535 RepID=A0ABP9BKW8_9GAMM
MPKPYLLARPSGLYVRFRVPRDLVPRLGFGSIVRSLHGLRGDAARLSAALQGVALSEAFARLRKGAGMADVDVKKLLESAQRAAEDGSLREWTATGVRVGGVDFGTVTTTGRRDTLDFIETMKAAAEMAREGLPMVFPSAALAAPVAMPALSALQGEPAPLLSVEIANHVADLEQRELSPDTITESKHSLRLLLGIVGDLPVDQIKAKHLRAFWEGVRWWPALATVKPKYRRLSVAETIAKGKEENVPVPSRHTRNKHRQRLSVFFNALVNMDVIPRSPLKGMGSEIDTGTELETGRPFTPEELKQIFAPEHFVPWAKHLPHRWWGPILGLYTGARVNEVAQLYIDDVRQVDGVWGLFVWKKDRNQKVKTKSSIRFIPLAQPVLDAGFLEFVEDMRKTGHPRLFPHLPAGTRKDGKPNGLGYGRQLSRQFSVYLRQFGIEKGTAFHAFRHTLATALAEALVPTSTIALITGHASKVSVSVLETHYIHIADVKTLPERSVALAKFRPEITIQSYGCCQFEKSMMEPSSLHL